MKKQKLQIGIVGLGRAFTIMMPTFMHHPMVTLAGATDPVMAARQQFEKDFGAPTYASLEELCANPAVQLVYVATPHQFHVRHVEIAASFGKHILVEKPMALAIDDCTRMIDAARNAGVYLIVGPSHSFDTPILRTRAMLDSGIYGKVKMIHALDFTDFLYRPRRPEELDTRLGGGVIHSQAAHQIDVVRMLGGGRVRSVQAHTGAWDSLRPTEGAYSALLDFENGAFASTTYSGYGHYDSDVLMGNIGESGETKNPGTYGAARKRLNSARSPEEEAALKAARNYGGKLYQPNTALPLQSAHQHFGPVVVCCERADLRPTPFGIEVYADESSHIEVLQPPWLPRSEVIDELCAAVLDGVAPLHTGQWARATTEVCLAILEAARTRGPVSLQYQCRPGETTAAASEAATPASVQPGK